MSQHSKASIFRSSVRSWTAGEAGEPVNYVSVPSRRRRGEMPRRAGRPRAQPAPRARREPPRSAQPLALLHTHHLQAGRSSPSRPAGPRRGSIPHSPPAAARSHLSPSAPCLSPPARCQRVVALAGRRERGDPEPRARRRRRAGTSRRGEAAAAGQRRGSARLAGTTAPPAPAAPRLHAKPGRLPAPPHKVPALGKLSPAPGEKTQRGSGGGKGQAAGKEAGRRE